jgi:tetratricopeptide (TPR) repeat protein
MISKVRAGLAMLLLAGTAMAETRMLQNAELEAGKLAFERSEYSKAVQILQTAAAKEPRNGEIQLMLAKSYYELEQRDAAVNSAERAVAIDPENSVYHEWLGRAYGEKADHAGLFSAMGLAKKTRKEFEKAVQLDERNFSAMQELIEFDCAAPGMVGGGLEKAKPEITRLAEMDAAEGHYAEGNCRRQKKEFEAADAEFTKALESHPKSTDVIFDIGDYAVRRNQPERLEAVATAGERVKQDDPRWKFYRAVGLILENAKAEQAEKLLRDYLNVAPTRTAFPRPAMAHVWLGKLYESQAKTQEAENEFETALKLDPKNKLAQEALKKLKKG